MSMDQEEINEANRALLEKFLERVLPGELIAGIVTLDGRSVVAWYPVKEENSKDLLEKLKNLGAPRFKYDRPGSKDDDPA